MERVQNNHHFESRSDLERWLRKHGLPVRAARKIAAGGFAALARKAKNGDSQNAEFAGADRIGALQQRERPQP